MKLSVSACLSAAALAGCGGSTPPSNQQQITGVLQSYLHAQVVGDGEAGCSVLTSTAQNQLISLVVKAGKGVITIRPTCADAVGLVRVAAGASLLGALRSARVEKVQVSGTQATAKIVDGAQFPPQTVTLEKVGAAWKITGVPALGT